MTTMAKKKTKQGSTGAKPSDQKPLPGMGTLEQQHEAAIANLMANTMEMEYTISRLPAYRVVSDATKTKMVGEVGGKKKGFSISKRLFSNDHPLIRELNAAAEAINKWRNAFVIVKGAEGTVDEDGKAKIASGVRLIQTEDIPAFEAGFKVRVDAYYAAAEAVAKHMDKPYFDGKKTWPSVLDFDKQMLGDDFNKDDYPKDVAACCQVVMPTYTEYKVSIKLPGEVQKRQELRLQEALNGTLETATGYVCKTLNDVFLTFAQSLSNRVRVKPVIASLARFVGAEVANTIEREGKVTVTLRYGVNEGTEEDPKIVTKLETLAPMTQEEFNANYRPYSTDEKRKLTKSVLDNIFEQMESIGKVREMLGPYGQGIESTLSGIRDILSSAGSSSEQILNEARNSKFYRQKLEDALNTAVVKLDETTEEVKKVRRKISKKLMGAV